MARKAKTQRQRTIPVKKEKPEVAVYFPVPKAVAEKLQERCIEEDRSTNKIIWRLIASCTDSYNKTGKEIPICESEADEIGQFTRLPQGLIADIDEIAMKHDRTRTRMVRQMVVAEVDGYSK